MSDPGQRLLETPIGNTFTATEATQLAEAAKMVDLPAGKVLFTCGSPGNALFVVLSGSLDVMLGQAPYKETVVTTLGPGQLIGELELMTHSLRVASVVAKEPSSLLELPSTTFDEMLSANHRAANKLVFNIAKTLARRLAAVNQRILEKSPEPVGEEEGETPQSTSPAETAANASSPANEQLNQLDDEDLDVLDKLWG